MNIGNFVVSQINIIKLKFNKKVKYACLFCGGLTLVSGGSASSASSSFKLLWVKSNLSSELSFDKAATGMCERLLCWILSSCKVDPRPSNA